MFYDALIPATARTKVKSGLFVKRNKASIPIPIEKELRTFLSRLIHLETKSRALSEILLKGFERWRITRKECRNG
jgi:hypothetical protein